MSKLTKSMIPGYGANPTKPNSNPLSGLAPDLETGLPQGLASGVGKAALHYSNPVGGFAPDMNGDIGYRKGWLDNSSNGTPEQAPKGPGYNVWADPDVTQRGWGWGMGANGALHTGTMGGGPAGTPWGPRGTSMANTGANNYSGSTGTNTGAVPSMNPMGAGSSNLGQLGHSIAGGLTGMAGGAGGLTGFGQALAQGMRQFNANGGLNGMPPQGPQPGAGGPMGAGMGVPPGMAQGSAGGPAPGAMGGTPTRMTVGNQALINQLRGAAR
jgi:hypothetical protein